MMKLLISLASYLIANAVGLLVAVLILPGFTIDFTAFVVAVLIFSAFQTIAGPLVTKISLKQVPQLVGGISLVTIILGLLFTSLIMPAMTIGGVANLLAATLLVWLGSLIAAILLPIYVFKSLAENRKERNQELEREVERANRTAEHAAASASAAQAEAQALREGRGPSGNE